MKKYKCVQITRNTETELNEYAEKGWKVVCRSWKKWWFVLEKEIKNE